VRLVLVASTPIQHRRLYNSRVRLLIYLLVIGLAVYTHSVLIRIHCVIHCVRTEVYYMKTNPFSS
jgi:hypothetical protein